MKSIPSDAMHLSDITSFGKNYDPLSMNISFEAEKFEPEPTFEKTINEIKDNHLKSIASFATNPSAITSFDENVYLVCINNSFEAEKFEPESIFEKTINEIKDNHPKSIASAAMNLSALNFFTRILNSLV